MDGFPGSFLYSASKTIIPPEMEHKMPSAIIQMFEGASITEEMLSAAAKLFGLNHGVWGPLAADKMGPFARQGEFPIYCSCAMLTNLIRCVNESVCKETEGADPTIGS